MRTRRLTPLLALCLLATGCGDDATTRADTSAAAPAATTATAPPGTTTTARPASPAGPDATVRAYFAALTRREGDAACGLLTKEAQRTAITLVEADKKSTFRRCGLALRAAVADRSDASLRAAKVQVKKTTVDGDRAKVAVENGAVDIELRRLTGRWYISAGFG